TRPRVEATQPRVIPDPGARGQDARRSARLERASDGATPWAERFDRTLEGLFAVAGRASARRSTARRGLRDLGGVDARAAALVLAAIRPGSGRLDATGNLFGHRHPAQGRALIGPLAILGRRLTRPHAHRTSRNISTHRRNGSYNRARDASGRH